MGELKRDLFIKYPAGTQATIFRMPYDSEDIEGGLIAYAVTQAVRDFRREYRANLPVEDMFITLAFSTFELSVEVSDRLTR